MSRSDFAGIFSALLFLASAMFPRAGLDTSPVCAALPHSQAVRAGSWLAVERDKMQKAEAVWLKHGTNRGTIYHLKLAEQSLSAEQSRTGPILSVTYRVKTQGYKNCLNSE